VADRLYFSCELRNPARGAVLAQFGKMLEQFPFSKLAKRGPVLRIYAIEHSEPPLIEREFDLGTPMEPVLEAAREFVANDCAVEIDAYWDLWQWDADWKLAPAAVTLACFAPEFEEAKEDQLRIEFGADSRFLPMPGIDGGLRMGESNLKSLLKLVKDLEDSLDLVHRRLWSESGANFADVLRETLGNYYSS
jgi:hypothetical protein